MVSVAQHYSTQLAPIYVWMAGGMASALARGDAEVDALFPHRAPGRVAVDLGAGFGMHAIPLARRGYAVLAIDSSALLLETLRDQAGALPVHAVEDDLLAFPRHLETKADLIVCMGDTLTHLPDRGSVERVLSQAADAHHAGGQLVTTFRDYTVPLLDERRFIHVRSDSDRILTCFLEYLSDHVVVHDLIHERDGSTWRLRVSAYRKLRLSPESVSAALQSAGFAVRAEPGLAGMVRLIATRR
jgi:SAM-dependent methyltransferase